MTTKTRCVGMKNVGLSLLCKVHGDLQKKILLHVKKLMSLMYLQPEVFVPFNIRNM